MATPEQVAENWIRADMSFLFSRYPCLALVRLADPDGFDANYRQGFDAMCRKEAHRHRQRCHRWIGEDVPLRDENAASTLPGAVQPDWGAQYRGRVEFVPPPRRRLPGGVKLID